MAKPSSRQGLIDYCLRKLGAPVLEINVADDQIDDLVDDAIQLFNERHFDGVERMYLKYKITEEDINRGTAKNTDGVGIVTTSDTDGLLTNGVKVSDATTATAIQGYIENVGGPISTLAVTNTGQGFVASQTYTAVPLYNITGNGSGMTATIATNSDGQVSSASVTSTFELKSVP